MSKCYKNMETKNWCGFHINHPIAVIDEFFMWYHIEEVLLFVKDMITYASSKEKYSKDSTYDLMNIYHAMNSLVIACNNILYDDYILNELFEIEKTLNKKRKQHMSIQEIKLAFKVAFNLYNTEKWKYNNRKIIYLALESFNKKFGRKLQEIATVLPKMILAAAAILEYEAVKSKILLAHQTSSNMP